MRDMHTIIVKPKTKHGFKLPALMMLQTIRLISNCLILATSLNEASNHMLDHWSPEFSHNEAKREQRLCVCTRAHIEAPTILTS